MFCQIKSCDVQCSYNNSDFSYKNLRWGLLVLCSHVSLHVQFAHAFKDIKTHGYNSAIIIHIMH